MIDDMHRKRVRLRAASDIEYVEFGEAQVLEYAEQLWRGGEVERESAVPLARARLDELINGDLRAREHHVWVAASVGGDTRVGWVWVSPAPEFLGSGHERTRWLSQLTVAEGFRRRGWGRAILAETERRLAADGVEQLWLRVFDWNRAARQLYESMGYAMVTQFPTDAHLRKWLSRAVDEGGSD